MPQLNTPRHQLKPRLSYTYVRGLDFFGITLGSPDSQALESIGPITPSDSGKVIRDGGVITWINEMRPPFFTQLMGVPREDQLRDTLDIAERVFPDFIHRKGERE